MVLREKVYVYNFQHLDLACSFPTVVNPLGLVSVNMSEDKCVLAFPSEQVGVAKLVIVASDKDSEN